jgi:flagellar biogenesis protein FliO
MRLLGLFALLPASAFAGDGVLGTKASAAAPAAAAGGVGPMPFLQMAIALGIVLMLVKWLLPKLAGKVGKRLVTNLGASIRIEESANFAGGTLYVVQAKSKTLLLGVTSAGVACLADLTETGPAADEPPTFQEFVEAAPGDPPMAAVVEFDPDDDAAPAHPDEDPERQEIAAALERLARLSG